MKAPKQSKQHPAGPSSFTRNIPSSCTATAQQDTVGKRAFSLSFARPGICSIASVRYLIPSKRLSFPSHVDAHAWRCLCRHLLSCAAPSWAQPGKSQQPLLLSSNLWQESLHSSGFCCLSSHISVPAQGMQRLC